MGKTTTDADRHAVGTATPKAPPVPVPVGTALSRLLARLEANEPVAFVGGAAATSLSLLIQRLLRETERHAVARVTEPTDDARAFWAALLDGFGFDPVDASRSDLRRLLEVFLRHEARKGRRPIVIVEDVDRCGPTVHDAIRTLIAAADRKRPVVFVVLTGSVTGEYAAGMPPMALLAIDPDAPLPLDTAPSPRIAIRRDDEPLGDHRLAGPKITIGRHRTNDLRLRGACVSRFHAMIVSDADGIHIVDLQSTNGTFVNGERVRQSRLHDGDRVGIERFVLVVHDPFGSRDDSDPGVSRTDLLHRSAGAS